MALLSLWFTVMVSVVVLIGLFIFFMVRVGKDRPGLAALVIGGLLLSVIAGAFAVGTFRSDSGSPQELQNEVTAVTNHGVD
ncbi:MAG TPA: hypothetical protein P5279_03610 [Anaerohalosphaeraceae bacterium]|jgi:nitrate/nitrite transporter NarK|nr:hypothetical protein [Anaerohalosphaeraceae bacterium]HRT49556.1 hypothetical protein [Anaerohalosphaeraceae bacterium]HRT85509.1 hypothetical protein [Anaerohalosphaeraceae bacterium]